MNDPLHIEVARALGWTVLQQGEDGRWFGVEPYGGLRIAVPAYDRSWCSLGPIIERFRFSVGFGHRAVADGDWWARSKDLQTNEYGQTACEAVAKLIVHLKKEGKLPND